MLTLDLIDTRMYRGEVRPRYVDSTSSDLTDLAAQLIGVFEDHRGRMRGELTGALGELSGTGTNYRFHRALAKLLLDRCQFEVEGSLEPQEARRVLFAISAGRYRTAGDQGAGSGEVKWRFDRVESLRAASAELEIRPDELERVMYADLKDQQRLVAFESCSPRWLLERYNVALAQGVVLRATELLIEVSTEDSRLLRALVHKIKFFRLLHRCERTAAGYRIRLDGPLSVFKASGRYGLQMALFLPSMLHFDHWRLSASVRWGKPPKMREFKLQPGSGLKPINAARGQWRPEDLEVFRQRFEALDSDWEILDQPRLVELGGGALVVSDFVFRPSSGDRESIALEVLGFWRRGSVARRLEQLQQSGTGRVLIAVGRGYATGEADLEDEDDPRLLLFRRTLLPKRVLAALNRLSESL